jgi:hypothetical protein
VKLKQLPWVVVYAWIGLHSGALAAKEMGGSLSVFSEGPGHGSTFTLELPVGTAGRHADKTKV